MKSTDERDRFGLVGQILAERYQVDAVVEETGLSVVYRAIHLVWRRRVAIKAFKSPVRGEEARRHLLEAFVREGALLTELSERTAAICQARDVASFTTPAGEWVPYMVLEWLDGQPLDVVLASERARGDRPRSLEQAMYLLAPVARALGVAHSRGIVHRDIKPGNICVMADAAERAAGPTKLLDFGIAVVGREARELGQAPVVDSLTPAYAAPEQFSSEFGSIGPWTDVFALALILVELVAGREALAGESLGQLAQAACDTAKRPSPRTLGVHVGDAAELVLERALAVSPKERHASAAEFWLDLSRAAKEARIESSGTMPIPLLRPRAAST